MKVLTQELLISSTAIALLIYSVARPSYQRQTFLGFSAGITVTQSLKPWNVLYIVCFQCLVTLLVAVDVTDLYVYLGYPLVAVGTLVYWRYRSMKNTKDTT